MKDNSDYYQFSEKELRALGEVIEMTLESFNITTAIHEIVEYYDYIQFNLNIALGTSIDEVIKHEKDIAIGLASPSGTVEILAPIPGRALIGVRVTKKKIDYANIEKPIKIIPIKLNIPKTKKQSDWRIFIAVIIYKISGVFEKLGDKITKKI
jgi:DNA segregation ATPase FtsK/SpoIIIE-like protein